ncbi:MAG: cytochrome c biogenesis protein ResB, partial [Desulfobulbaceae bacterium]|nr:cytochrome c biogenesis protein ResB [Desulfobulbaceae bacterium]
MKKEKNALWEFFASVKLALFVLIVLAITSIIGTIIPQGESYGFYVGKYGPTTAQVFKLLNVPDMYNAWWFLSFLVLLSINLTVCSIERLPNVLRLMGKENLKTDSLRISRMRSRAAFFAASSVEESAGKLKEALGSSRWKMMQSDVEDGVLFFLQKGAWTRLGVFTVHFSILVIFAGAIIGSLFGYKASIMLPEGARTDFVYLSDGSGTKMPLGFTLRCDRFDLSYYDTGAPKEYRSRLVVEKDGKELLAKEVIVNDPLQYGGLTFYQASYQGLENQYFADIENRSTKARQKFLVTPRKESKWPDQGVTFGIVGRMGPDWQGKYRHKIWFSDGQGAPSQFQMEENATVVVQRPGTEYTFFLKQRFATGLQVAKDPGVWWVYIGCTLMLLGLYVAFFTSHRRIWLHVSREGSRSRVLVGGLSNKDKLGFENEFSRFSESLTENGRLN